jgi:hypothetical protein
MGKFEIRNQKSEKRCPPKALSAFRASLLSRPSSAIYPFRISDFDFRILPLLLLLTGCASPPPYVYTYIPGRTAVLRDGCAIAPPAAPPDVQVAVAAANRISGLPYSYGAGHTGAQFDTAYDCSGAASFVLRAAGLLDSPIPSLSFRHYGQPGPGDWITIYARRDHVFLVIAGLRFDTGWTGRPRGPQWTEKSRPTDGTVMRHPDEL